MINQARQYRVFIFFVCNPDVDLWSDLTHYLICFWNIEFCLHNYYVVLSYERTLLTSEGTYTWHRQLAVDRSDCHIVRWLFVLLVLLISLRTNSRKTMLCLRDFKISTSGLPDSNDLAYARVVHLLCSHLIHSYAVCYCLLRLCVWSRYLRICSSSLPVLLCYTLMFSLGLKPLREIAYRRGDTSFNTTNYGCHSDD